MLNRRQKRATGTPHPHAFFFPGSSFQRESRPQDYSISRTKSSTGKIHACDHLKHPPESQPPQVWWLLLRASCDWLGEGDFSSVMIKEGLGPSRYRTRKEAGRLAADMDVTDSENGPDWVSKKLCLGVN